ncbi:MAG TPA: hypothetical protein VK772_05930 [Puia sp.]|jgi:hypothetical protein|nr:hypothetical protein [Puia sp.]
MLQLTESSLSQQQALAIKPDYLPGSCPYPCTDVRCKAYLNGYCGNDTIAIIKNTNNPYDNVGQQHNNGVRAIFPTIGSSNNIDSLVLTKVDSYVVTIGYSSDSMKSFYNREVLAGYFPFSHVAELDSLGNKMQTNGLISTYANSYVQQIFTYSSNYFNSNTITNAMYSSYASSLISLESTIKNDSRISSWEKQVLLSISAVGRYSASYWGNYFNSGSNNDLIRPLLKIKLSNLWKVVISDIAGGLIGLSGGAVGIIGGAVGTSIVTAITLP